MHKVTSLKATISYRLIIPILIFTILETALSYYVTLHYVEKTYDRRLLDSAHLLVQEVKIIDNQISVALPMAALEIFKWDDIDTTFFKITTEKGKLIAGEARLPTLLIPTNTFNPIYSTSTLNGEPIRIVSLQVPGTLPEKVFIHIAETLNKRQDMIVDILLADLIPQMLLIVFISLLIIEAINHGLAPLHKLAKDISQRSPSDLSQIPESDVFTEVKSLTDTINNLLEKLSIASNAQQRFIANAAHQLRTPLAGLKLQAELAQREENILNMRPALSQIQNSADRTSHLITQLLSLARATPIEKELPLEKVELNQLVQKICIEWIPKALKKEIEISFESSAKFIFVRADSILLSELLNNLLDNAICYGYKKGTISVKLSSSPIICLTVEDDGPGIPESEKDKIFERFYRSPSSSGEGCGLGLAIVKEIASLHKIKICLRNSNSGGTKIDLQFKNIGKNNTLI